MDEEHLAGGTVRSRLEQSWWEFLIPWIMELARGEEHRAWREVVHHTRRRARDLIRDKHLSDDTHFDQTKCYGDVAARVAGILAEDYSEHAFPRRPAAEPAEPAEPGSDRSISLGAVASGALLGYAPGASEPRAVIPRGR